jgi:DNA-binding transcriptional regulator YhcF (GntR family)
MKFWISKNSEVSIHEQIVTQVRLGIASRDLEPGEKLPSTREFARRFGVHANTVSAAYRDLASEGVLDFRKGSGVFIAEAPTSETPAKDLDAMLAAFAAEAFAAQFSRTEIESAMHRWLSQTRERQLLLVESDPGLSRILKLEIADQVGVSIEAVTFEEFCTRSIDESSIVTALFDEKEKIMPLLRPGRRSVFIDANSIPSSLLGSERPASDALIAIATCWAPFAALAKVYLLAAKIEPEALLVRLTDEPGWNFRLEAASVIICDSYTAGQFQDDPRLRVFRVTTADSIDRIRRAIL